MRALSTWFHLLKDEPGRPRLICFPFAGGGISAYRGWDRGLTGVAEVIVARPPGRESRMKEKPIADVTLLVRAAQEALMPILDERPFALYGHSVGAWVAFELARSLFRGTGRRPTALFLSGQHAPDFDPGRENVSHLPRERFMKELVDYDGTPPELLAETELMDLMLPMLRADFAAAENYERVPGPPLDVPLYVYNGRGDRDVPPGAADDWAREVVQAPVFREFEGGHFFVQSARDELLAALRGDLQTAFGAVRAA